MQAAAVARPRTCAAGRAIILALCAALISACSGTSLPFSKSDAAKPTSRTSPQVTVRRITGLPEDKATALVNAFAKAATRRDIAIVGGPVEGAYVLTGHFQAQPAGATVGYSWMLTDAEGQHLHEIVDTEPARPVGEDPWAGVDEDVIARIAAYTAERLSSRFSQLGFATRIAGLPPPVDHMVKAGPGAEKDIDFETLYGPNAIAAADPALAMAADETDGDSADDSDDSDAPLPMQTEAAPAEARPSSGSDDDTDAGDAADSIRAVTVAEVSGSKGAGNGELSRALKRVLSSAGWPVEDRPGEGTLAIHGDISIGEPRGELQKVALRWTVKAPDGQVLGTIEQANDVPAGSLDQGWGKAADYAAEAAAEGIFDLVNQLR